MPCAQFLHILSPWHFYIEGILKGKEVVKLIEAMERLTPLLVAVVTAVTPIVLAIASNGKKDRAQQKEDGTRVGLWSVKRLLELMYDRKNLFLISNVEPHGALNQIYIPRRPVNERSMEYMDEQGIR